MLKVDLLIIDPQYDFCNSNGSLFVDGADKDMERVGAMIKRIKSKLNTIHVTLDTHHLVDIAHPIFWRNSSGNHPDPFTIIEEGSEWITTQPSLYKQANSYLKKLKENKRYPLCIWPPHCLIGSLGHTIVPEIFEALNEWESNFAMVDFVTKGSNPFTEHYSGVKADVSDPTDPTTQINTRLIKTLINADLVGICGEAGSHCLANTVRDIADEFGDESYIKKLVLLTDGTSPVKGYENLQIDFIEEMKNRGMQLSTTEEFLK